MWTTPPSRRSSVANPWVMAALPPATTGQPAPWPSAVRRRPKADVSGAVSGSMECAAVPAKSARAASVLKRRAVCCTEGVPTSAKRASANGSARQAAHGPKDVGHDPVEPVHERPHQLRVRGGIATEVSCRLAHVPVERGGPPAPERMGERHLRLAENDPEAGEVQRAEEGRRHQGGVHRRAHIVAEALKGQGLGPGPASDGRLPFEDLHPMAGPGQCQRGGQAIGARTDHDGIRNGHGPTLPTATAKARAAAPLALQAPGQ